VKSTSIKQALQHVADYPDPDDDNWLTKPTHELVCRTLFDIANHPDPSERGALTRANAARKMIFDRLVGKRRAGSHPATRNVEAVEFVDLTKGELT
jgi:hypothetical protein